MAFLTKDKTYNSNEGEIPLTIVGGISQHQQNKFSISTSTEQVWLRYCSSILLISVVLQTLVQYITDMQRQINVSLKIEDNEGFN